MVTETKGWQPNARQAACLLGFSKNSEYYVEHQEEIKKNYAGKFIAILKDNIVANSDNGKELIGHLRESYPDERECSSIFVVYVPTEQEVRIA